MRACSHAEREGKQLTHTAEHCAPHDRGHMKKTPALPSGTPAFLFPTSGAQSRRNRLAPYTSADSAVIQKLVGQSV
ncbi:hypothetical protein BLA23254_07777 [Burkholderia lata]|uniref:Uncharacterized protein n=1 Tax=Burkholderia lata (strain ATCC 17760 / DSM 23089 / LMG 22485 / NCIMB 9086 / R18194 / 383) TaxID=482957 RepID=A0A6P2SKU0_BURL3|nr:hypothetical protein BLA23254_07777 [Burkholderia lata]